MGKIIDMQGVIGEIAERQPPTAEELLQEYVYKPVKKFCQIDGFVVVPEHEDDALHPDAQGHALMGGDTYELRNTGSREMPVRVLIHENARKSDVIPLLRKITDWLVNDWGELIDPQVRALKQRQFDAMVELLSEEEAAQTSEPPPF